MGSTVVKKSLEKENHRAEGAIKRLEETQNRERRKNEDLQNASHIKRGEWNDALFEACKIGNKEIVEMMIKKGANNWDGGLRFACKGGNNDIQHYLCKRLCNDGSDLLRN